MADKKISALTGATTPLAGTEVLPIVQSGATVKVAVSDLTAGRAVTALTYNGNTITTGTGVLTLAAGKTLTASNTLTLAGTDATTQTFPTTSATIARTDAAQTFTGDQTLSTGNIVQGTAAKGFDFSANTPQAGKTSTILNWYEEGTWTPNQGGAVTVVGAFSSSGRYTKVGRQVTVCGEMSGATTIAVVAANTLCSNLPFTCATNSAGSFSSSVATGGQVTAVGGSTDLYIATTLGPSNRAIIFTVTYFV